MRLYHSKWRAEALHSWSSCSQSVCELMVISHLIWPHKECAHNETLEFGMRKAKAQLIDWKIAYFLFIRLRYVKRQPVFASIAVTRTLQYAEDRKLAWVLIRNRREAFIYRSMDLYSHDVARVPLPDGPSLWFSIRSMHPLAFPSVALNHPENTW